MKKTLIILLLFSIFLLKSVAEVTNTKHITQKRINEIAQMLGNEPVGIGVSYKDRAFWDKIKLNAGYKKIAKEIPLLVKNGLPSFSDSLYCDYFVSGDRDPGIKMVENRFNYLYKLTLAECTENKNKYTKEIEKTILEIAAQKSWMHSCHERKFNSGLSTFHGNYITIDLGSATHGNGYAQCMFLLDDKISPEVKQIGVKALYRNLFDPMKKAIATGELMDWMTWTLNWNSVCLAGLVGSANAVLTNKEERAFFLAVAEQYYTYSLDGYEDDGYCSEGVGYYNYGFRSLIVLRELVCRTTQGQIDFFETPKLFKIADFARNIVIMNNVCPAYSDCAVDARPGSVIENYCNNIMWLQPYKEVYSFPSMSNFSLNLINFFPNQAWMLKSTSKQTSLYHPLRSYFNIGRVYVGRPDSTSVCRIGVSAKGGHNAENHNHNDVGSYSVVSFNELMAGDQGRPDVYPASYWAEDCYIKWKIKGSYGHPVPFVNGMTQRDGRDAEGKVLKKSFTALKDIFAIDIKSCYNDSTLKNLQRTFVYNRKGKGAFTVNDEFSFTQPGEFETAITTRANWKIINPTTIELIKGKEKVYVKIDASSKCEIGSSIITENAPSYTRISIKIIKKVKSGHVKLSYSN